MGKILKTSSATFVEVAVHCTDIDSGDEMQMEVLINERLERDRFDQATINSAKKDCVLEHSGNTIEYDIIGPTGRKVLVTKTYEELSPRTNNNETEFVHG